MKHSTWFVGLLAMPLFVPAASTMPVGGMRLTIAAGTGTSRTNTVLSLPLIIESTAVGQLVGRIAIVTSNTITVTNAGWTAGQLSTAATPHFIRITSGSATGRSFLISTASANTSTTLTIDAEENVDLTTLGIVTGASGDTFRIYAADTLGNVFPSHPTVLGGSSVDVADNLQLYVQGAWRTYFYSTTSNRWTRSVLGNPEATNVAIRPDAAIIYSRLGNTTVTLSVLGVVPSTDRRAAVANTGVTFSASSWPVNLTLGTSGIHLISTWRSSGTVSNADTVQMLISGGWRTYYYDGSNWRRSVLGNPLANTEAISAGSGLILSRAAGSGTAVLYQPQPYTLP
jgi:uncharacterized protein (TIGR02597 family)